MFSTLHLPGLRAYISCCYIPALVTELGPKHLQMKEDKPSTFPHWCKALCAQDILLHDRFLLSWWRESVFIRGRDLCQINKCVISSSKRFNLARQVWFIHSKLFLKIIQSGTRNHSYAGSMIDQWAWSGCKQKISLLQWSRCHDKTFDTVVPCSYISNAL